MQCNVGFFLGYSLQLLQISNGVNAYPYKGEWTSRVISVTNEWMCVSLNISVPATFHVSVDLVTNTSTKTVYTVDNVVGETTATDMLTVFEVQVDVTQTSYSQLVVYVSEGTVIRNVNVHNDHCNRTGKCRDVTCQSGWLAIVETTVLVIYIQLYSPRVIAELSKNIKIITTNTKCTVHHYDDSLSQSNTKVMT